MALTKVRNWPAPGVCRYWCWNQVENLVQNPRWQNLPWQNLPWQNPPVQNRPWTFGAAVATYAPSLGTRETASRRTMTACRRSYRGPRVPTGYRTRDHGEENRRLYQATDTRRQGEPVSAGRPGARSAGPEYHEF